MHVKMGNRLSAVGSVVHHESEAGRKVELPRHRSSHQQQVPEQLGVFGLSGPDSLDESLRNHEEMDGRLGV